MMRPLLLVAALGVAGLALADEPANTAGILRLKLSGRGVEGYRLAPATIVAARPRLG